MPNVEGGDLLIVAEARDTGDDAELFEDVEGALYGGLAGADVPSEPLDGGPGAELVVVLGVDVDAVGDGDGCEASVTLDLLREVEGLHDRSE